MYDCLTMIEGNWLMSACAQTAGALVAIVGGFLVTRLVTLSAERNGLEDRIRGTDTMLALARRQEALARAAVVSRETALLASECREDLVDSHGEATELDTSEYEPYTLSEAEVEECIADVARAVRNGYALLQKHPVRWSDPEECGEFLAANGIPVSAEERSTFEAVYRRLWTKAQDQKPVPTVFGVPFPDTPRLPLLGIMPSIQEQQFDAMQHVSMVEQWRAAGRDVSRLDQERQALRSRLRETGRPSGLVPAVVILVYLSTTGVMLPLALLPAEQISPGTKWTVIGLFFLGLVALLVFFVSSCFRLGHRRAEDSANGPR